MVHHGGKRKPSPLVSMRSAIVPGKEENVLGKEENDA